MAAKQTQPGLGLGGDAAMERRDLSHPDAIDVVDAAEALCQPPQLPSTIVNESPRQLRAPGAQVANVGSLIEMAIDKGITPEALEKLVYLQERVMEKQAKDEFFRAMADLQAECPVIGKNASAKIKTKGGGEYGYKYADLAHVAEMIKPVCDRHGFSYSFKQSYDKDMVHTTCVVRHHLGHQEETTFSGPWANESGMSAMQKAVAATTTARRMALVLAFGLSIGEDDDGAGPPAHENTPRDPSAPKAQPRAQRQQAPTTPPVVTGDMLKAWFKAWCVERDISAPSEEDKRAFRMWCASQTGRDFQYGVPALWTEADARKVCAALNLPWDEV